MPYSTSVVSEYLCRIHAVLGLTLQDAHTLAQNAHSYTQVRVNAMKIRKHLEKGWGVELFDFSSQYLVYPSNKARPWARLARALRKSCIEKCPECTMTLEDATGIVVSARTAAGGADIAVNQVKDTLQHHMDAFLEHLRQGHSFSTFIFSPHARGYMLKSKRIQHVIPLHVIQRVIYQYGELNTHFADCVVPYSPVASARLRTDFPLENVTFINAPHSKLKTTKSRIGWVEKCHLEAQRGANVVLLLPVRTDTVWFQDIILEHTYKIFFLKGRLRFCNTKSSAPFPSMLVHMTTTTT